MKEIVIVSGKGGTGKTMFTGSLAILAQNKVLADCDVDAANLNLLLNPEFDHKDNFFCGNEYYRIASECTECGKCLAVCRYGAIDENFDVDNRSCESCAACYYACPNKAIGRIEKLAGYCLFSNTSYGQLIHAELNPGEDNSGKLVTLVKKEARLIAQRQKSSHIIIDGPPGLGCPVNAALTGSQIAVIITEPTLSGIHDLKRIISVCQHFCQKTYTVINKSTLNTKNTAIIRNYCSESGVCIAGEISYSQDVFEAIQQGKNILELFPDHEVSRQIKNIWQEIQNA